MRTLLPLLLAKPWLKKPWVEIALALIRESSRLDMRVQLPSWRFTRRVPGLTIWKAGHWLDQR
jgi:hypothetical protein